MSDGGDYAERLSRLRHADVEMDGITWAQACARWPDGCNIDDPTRDVDGAPLHRCGDPRCTSSNPLRDCDTTTAPDSRAAWNAVQALADGGGEHSLNLARALTAPLREPRVAAAHAAVAEEYGHAGDMRLAEQAAEDAIAPSPAAPLVCNCGSEGDAPQNHGVRCPIRP